MTDTTNRLDNRIETWWPWIVAAGMGIIILFIHRPWMWHPDGPAAYDPAGHRWMLGEIRDVWSRGQLTGRTLDQSLGMPILRHYYPLVPSVSAALGWLIGDGRAIAWMATLPSVLAPAAAVWALPKRHYDVITRMLSASGMSVMAFANFPNSVNFTGFAFNRVSVWSGAYSTAWSLLLLLVAVGCLSRVQCRSSVGWTDVGLGLLLGYGLLSMPLIGVAPVLVAGWVFWKRWARLLIVCGSAFFISAWWLIPAVAAGPLEAIIHRGKPDAPPSILLGIADGDLLLVILIPVVLAGIGVWVQTGVNNTRVSVPQTIIAVACVSYLMIVVFYLLPGWTVWNQRFMPIWLVSVMLLSAIGIGYVINSVLWKQVHNWKYLTIFGILLIIISAFFAVSKNPVGLPRFIKMPVNNPAFLVATDGPVLSSTHNTTYWGLVGGQDAGSLFYEQTPTNLFVLQVSKWRGAHREGCYDYFLPEGLQDFVTACHNNIVRSTGLHSGKHMSMVGSLGIDWVLETKPEHIQEYQLGGWDVVDEQSSVLSRVLNRTPLIMDDVLLRSPDYPSPRVDNMVIWLVWDGVGSYLESAVDQFRRQPDVWLTDRPLPEPPSQYLCDRPVIYEYNAYQVKFTGTRGCSYVIKTTWSPGFSHAGTADGIVRAGPFMAITVANNNKEVRITWGHSRLAHTAYGLTIAGMPFVIWVVYYLKYRRRR